MDKRQQLIVTAFELFYRHGIHAVGINQILQHSGVAKKTLYHHFPGKEALVEAVVTHRDHNYLEWLDTRLARAEGDVPAVIEALFNALDDWFNDRVELLTEFHGCFFINTCGEYGDPEHQVHRRCARHKAAVLTCIAGHLARCGLEPEKARALADTLGLLKEGAIVQAHVMGDKQAALKGKTLATTLTASCLEPDRSDNS